jgi:hypothetical protein
VTLPQAIFAAVLVVVLLGLAGYFSWRQFQALRGLRSADQLPPEDRRYIRNQAWRRLAGSVLMVVFAGFLVGAFFIEGLAGELAERMKAATPAEREALTADNRFFLHLWSYYWIAALLVLLGLISLAALDFFAIRRYGQRHYRQIQADRRAMIERQAARLRRERNGHV